jgi:MinD superfamily P-loop ATPase
MSVLREIVVLSGKAARARPAFRLLGAVLPGAKGFAKPTWTRELELLLAPEILEEEPFESGLRAEIDPGACTGCGRCEVACRFRAVAVRDGRAQVDAFACEGCGVCALVCPEKAVSFGPVVQGRLFRSRTVLGCFEHARLRPGGANSGKLVQLLRRRARETALREGVSVLLVDGPPGIACPAISSLAGANVALLVTEPTDSARADLLRIAELAGRFRVPFGIVLNKADLSREGAHRTEELCAERRWPLLARFPFVEEIPRCIARREFGNGKNPWGGAAPPRGRSDLLCSPSFGVGTECSGGACSR